MSHSMLKLALAALVLPPAAARAAEPSPDLASLAGDWSAVSPGQPPMRIVLHVNPAPAGARVTLDAVDRNVFGLPIQDLRRDGARISFSIPAVGFRYTGELSASGGEITGTESQGSAPALPLVFRLGPSTAAPEPRASAPPSAWSVPSPDVIRRLLDARTGGSGLGVGVVVGVLRPGGRAEVVAAGVTDPAEAAPVGGGTVFAVDSLTKVFTGLLLADMARRGEVRLDDPVDRYLPAGVRAAERNGHKITLLDLATHTAGFPANPPGYDVTHPGGYSLEALDRFVAGYALTRDPGARWEYSNVGVALLGQALAQRAGMDFASLVRTRITGPLGMDSTAFEPTPAMAARLAKGHDFALHGVDEPAAAAFAPAWGLYSDAEDLMRLLRLQLGQGPAGLRASAALALKMRRPSAPGAEQALGWEVRQLGTPGAEVVFKNGGSAGYRSYAAFRPDTGAAVVVLTNALSKWAPDDVGLFVLTGLEPPPLPPPSAQVERAEIVVPQETLARYVGRYRITPEIEADITLVDGRLYGNLSGRPKIELFAETPTRFFAKATDAQAEFEIGPEGRPSGIRLTINGQQMSAARIPD